MRFSCRVALVASAFAITTITTSAQLDRTLYAIADAEY